MHISVDAVNIMAAKQLDAVTKKMWMAICVTFSSYLFSIDYFAKLAGTVRLFFRDVTCGVC